MFEKLECCPVCQSAKFTNHIICKDYTVSDESFVIVQCDACSFLFTNPRPTVESISTYYESEEYISHSNRSKSIIDFLYKIIRKFSLKKKVQLIENYSTEKTLLDYGCGTGHFLEAALTKGWNVTGVEPSASAQTIESVKSNIHSSIDQVDENQKFNIITLWHVLEHVHDLNSIIDKLKHHLTDRGKLIIAVPNPESYDAQYFKEYWAAYDVPRHLYHFTKDTFRTLLKKHQLKLEETKPMLFDSFYVSLLSNSYKYNSKKFINSFITGYKSNRYGKITNEYSSHIYIVSKK
ncbi:class I SAM-dependent methyltransferase [Fulvivirga lutea]|uniref:Class I SAM-dependent methyltransferase n=1 Tax=Fulvivirga lutea TaxID=2810512 RepID=A0A974WGL1_9BACT|nr:class I SAM-dependent methyltransferase [Fulvivirga lutea]QSE98144.1 class I SAM-dependent methyltransferase [Fulvivirga lutea]